MFGVNMLRKFKILRNWLSGYNFSDPMWNGEYRFLRGYLREEMVVFDVGANIGEYATYALSVAPNIEIHCFEPAFETFKRLQQAHREKANITLNNFGLSDITGRAQMKIFGETYGINSLYERRSSRAVQPAYENYQEQEVVLETFDKYVAEKNISYIDFLKIDVEGHELKVLQGARESICAGKISAIQFEYGSSFIDAQASLKEVYDLLNANNYRVFRLLPFGKWPIKSFDPVWGLENYQHSNWVALLA